MGVRGICLGLLLSASAISAADVAYDAHVRRVVTIMQRDTLYRPVTAERLRQLDARAVPELIRLIPRIQSRRALYLVGKRLIELGARQSIQAFIGTLTRSYPEDHTPWEHPGARVLYEWGWQAIGPLTRGLASSNARIRYYSARELRSLCAGAGAYDKRVRAAFCLVARTGDPPLQKIAAGALWMGACRFHYDIRDGASSPDVIVDMPTFRVLVDLAIDAENEVKRDLMIQLYMFVSSQLGAPPVRRDPGLVDPDRIAREREKLDIYFRSKLPAVRMAVLALRSWGCRPDRARIDALADESADVRHVALKTLIDNCPADSIPLIGEHLKSNRPEVRAIAAQALGVTFSPRALTFLRPLLKDPHPNVRKAVKQAIARINGADLTGSAP